MLSIERQVNGAVLLVDAETGAPLGRIVLTRVRQHKATLGFELSPSIKIRREEVANPQVAAALAKLRAGQAELDAARKRRANGGSGRRDAESAES